MFVVVPNTCLHSGMQLLMKDVGFHLSLPKVIFPSPSVNGLSLSLFLLLTHYCRFSCTKNFYFILKILVVVLCTICVCVGEYIHTHVNIHHIIVVLANMFWFVKWLLAVSTPPPCGFETFKLICPL